jgi:hypothetical protein
MSPAGAAASRQCGCGLDLADDAQVVVEQKVERLVIEPACESSTAVISAARVLTP